MTKKRKINPRLFTELAKQGINSFFDFVHATPEQLREAFTKTYYAYFRKEGYSPRDIPGCIDDLKIIENLGYYLSRYGFTFQWKKVEEPESD